MNFYQLKYFLSVAENLNFSNAAKKLHISQPALSFQIQNLESELGVKLFDRNNKKVTLTEAGAILIQHGQGVIDKVEETKRLLIEIDEGVKGELRIGAISSIAIHILPDLLKKMLKQYPQVRPLITYKNADEIIELLLANKIDLAIIADPKVPPQIEAIDLKKNEMFLVCAPDYPPFGEKKIVQVEELNGVNFIAFENTTPTAEIIDNFFNEHRIKVNYVLRTENIEIIKKMVEIGMGVSILPEHTIKLEMESKTLKKIPFKGKRLYRHLALLYCRGKFLTKSVKAFIELVVGKKSPA